MSVFTVHVRDNSGQADLVLIKDGFNWTAAIFGFIWALFVGAWGVACVLLVVEIVVGVVLKHMVNDVQVIGVVQFGTAVMIGFAANEFRRFFLQRAGFVEAGIVVGANKSDGERRYLDTHPDVTARLLENL